MIGIEWFVGVVEDINDPEKMDRVRVRMWGYHTDNKTYLPTNKLHWALVLDPTTSAAVSGIGQSHGIVNGTWVFGMFMDGQDMQQPAVMFSMKGKPEGKISNSKGFSDPNNEFPRFIKEPDTNRLARNESIDETIVHTKKNSVEKDVSQVNGSWSEPETPYNTTYPFNKVKETVSGHIEEFDDTPGAERIHQYHKSGSFVETHPDGTKVTKIVKDNYHIVAGDEFVLIKGKVQVHIGGDADLKITGNVEIMTDGDIKATIGGNATVKSSGNVKVDGSKIELNGGLGVITGASRCHFTGSPHGDVSTVVFAGKQ
jgi:hypothetical protein